MSSTFTRVMLAVLAALAVDKILGLTDSLSSNFG